MCFLLIKVYRFLATDVRGYLPGYQHCTIWHLKDLTANERTLIKCEDVQHVSIPLFEGLYTEDLLEYARRYNNGIIMRAFPKVKNEIDKLPRAYIGNICQTIAKDNFTQWVKQRVEARNAKIAAEKEVAINMDQNILDIFNASNAISGKLHN